MKNTFEKQRFVISRRKRIFFWLGWPLMLCGAGLLFYEPLFTLAFIFLVIGVIMRFLHYYAKFELKSLDKYEKLLSKVKIFLIIGLVFSVVSGNLFGQLKRGDEATELAEIDWVSGSPVKIAEETEGEKLFVIEFWASWDKASVLSFPLLSDIQEKYGEEKITVIALTKENKENVEKFINAAEGKINFRIGIDNKGSVTKKYLGEGSGVPKVFVVGKNKKILWSGNPVTAPSVVKKIFKGTFDPGIQDKITALHLKLQENIQMEKIPQAVKIADSIIGLDPSDELAMRIKLYSFERAGKLDNALTFLDSVIDKAPDTSSLYFIKLDLMDRLDSPVEDIHKTCKVIFAQFAEDHEVLEKLAWVTVSRMRFGTAPLSIALEASDKAVSMLIESKDHKPAKLANYLETQGRVYYLIGNIRKAVENQEKVIRLRKGDLEEKEAALFLDYYKEAAKLQNIKH